MNKRLPYLGLLLSGMLAASGLFCSSTQGEQPTQYYLLKVASIGFPTSPYQKDAWKINELKIFQNRLYIGYGDYTVNTGPTDVLSYDLVKHEFHKEFTADDEAIDRYVVLDGKLAFPGVDATESWDFGNVYILTDKGWRKHRTVPRGLHVLDIVSFNKKWYACIGTLFDYGKGESEAIGAVISSTDEGATWVFEYGTPSDKNSVFRVGTMAVFKDRLYGFPFAYTEMTKDEIPQSYRPYLGMPISVENGKEHYLVLLPDPLGSPDGIVYEGTSWKPQDFIPEPNVVRVTPFLFQDKLILSVVFGTYISSLPDYISLHRKLPPNASTALYVYDGREAKKLDFAFDRIADILVKEDKLFLLVLKEGRYGIAETRDLHTFNYYLLPRALDDPLSLEYDDSGFYIGTKDGNIFKTVDFEPISNPAEAKEIQPTRIYGGAELPRDGKRYWGAISEWQEWGKPATFSCELGPDNVIGVTTKNVAKLSIFVPQSQLNTGKPLTLMVDGQKGFEGYLNGRSELICSRNDKGIWKVHAGTGTAEGFKPTRKVVGKADLDLIRTGDDPPSGLWRAEVLRWFTNADIGIVNRSGAKKDLKKGDILLEDLLDSSYRNSIRTFRVKGQKLRDLISKNLTLPEEDRVQVAGFEFSLRSFPDPKKNILVSFPLDPEKDYLVATYDYLINESKDYFGEELKAEDSGVREPEAMIKWLAKYKKVGPLKPRIKVIKEN